MKKASLVMAFILAIGLSGCNKNEVIVTDEQNSLIAEYIAGKILDYDKYYESTLEKPANIEEIEEPTSNLEENTTVTENTTEANTQGTSDSNTSNDKNNTSENVTTVAFKNLSEVLSYKNFTIKYDGYVLADTYPDDSSSSYFTLVSSPGKKKLVTKFVLTNQTNKSIKVDLSEEEIQFQLKTSDGKTHKPELGLLPNDFRYIDTTISKKGKYEAVVVFDVDEKIDLNGAELIVEKASNSAKVKIS